jgi:hypothetical protein
MFSLWELLRHSRYYGEVEGLLGCAINHLRDVRDPVIADVLLASRSARLVTLRVFRATRKSMESHLHRDHAWQAAARAIRQKKRRALPFVMIVRYGGTTGCSLLCEAMRAIFQLIPPGIQTRRINSSWNG